jgi:hypothetical protein
MFVRALCSRVPVEDWPSLQIALQYLPDKQAYLHFKVLVCIQYLGQLSRTNGSVKPKRAAPRARGARAEDKRPAESDMGDSVIRTYTIPNWKSIVGPLVTASHECENDTVIHCKIKYELLIAYASLNTQKDSGERDAGWDEELCDGTLRRAIEMAFSPTIVQDSEEAESIKLLGELLGDILFETN